MNSDSTMSDAAGPPAKALASHTLLLQLRYDLFFEKERMTCLPWLLRMSTSALWPFMLGLPSRPCSSARKLLPSRNAGRSTPAKSRKVGKRSMSDTGALVSRGPQKKKQITDHRSEGLWFWSTKRCAHALIPCSSSCQGAQRRAHDHERHTRGALKSLWAIASKHAALSSHEPGHLAPPPQNGSSSRRGRALVLALHDQT